MPLSRARQNGAGHCSLLQPTTFQFARKRRSLRSNRLYGFHIGMRDKTIVFQVYAVNNFRSVVMLVTEPSTNVIVRPDREREKR